VREITTIKPIHRLPHRGQGLIRGLVNIRGELRICISLGTLLGLHQGNLTNRDLGYDVFARMMLIDRDSDQFVFPVTEVQGTHRFAGHDLRAVPTTIGKAKATYTRNILQWKETQRRLSRRGTAALCPEKGTLMSEGEDKGLGHFSLLELFRIEAESQLQSLSENLLALEQDAGNSAALEACMRAAHSLKGASRMVDIEAGVRINHALEDLFVAAQEGRLRIDADHIDHCLQALDLLGDISRLTEARTACLA
jgi:chemotaxis signal transduction protein/HPt (histidine-containing phosphotransfer) domain-containing protein